MRLGKDSVGPSSSDDAGGLHYGGQLSALRRGAGEGADEALGSPDVLAAKAAARAMEQMREQQLAEREVTSSNFETARHLIDDYIDPYKSSSL